jgi:hypothetical protein
MHKVPAACGELPGALTELERSTALLRELLRANATNVPLR